MPEAAASDGLSEIARVALPMRVRVSQQANGDDARRCRSRCSTMSIDAERDRAERAGSARSRAGQLRGAAADEELEDVAQREREADAHDHQLHDADALVVAAASRGSTSSTQPKAALAITASGIAIQSGQAERPPRAAAPRRAPKVTISPWAKFEMPGRAEDQREADRGEREHAGRS